MATQVQLLFCVPNPNWQAVGGLFPANALCMFLVHMQIPEAWCTSAFRSPFSLPGWHLEPSSSVKESLGRTYLSTKGRRSMYWRHVYKTQSAFLHSIPSNWWYNFFWTGIIFLNNSSSLQTVPLAWFQNRLFSLHRDETMLASDSQGAKPGRDRTVWRRIGTSLFVNPDFGFLPVLPFFFFIPDCAIPSENKAHLFILPGGPGQWNTFSLYAKRKAKLKHFWQSFIVW